MTRSHRAIVPWVALALVAATGWGLHARQLAWGDSSNVASNVAPATRPTASDVQALLRERVDICRAMLEEAQRNVGLGRSALEADDLYLATLRLAEAEADLVESPAEKARCFARALEAARERVARVKALKEAGSASSNSLQRARLEEIELVLRLERLRTGR